MLPEYVLPCFLPQLHSRVLPSCCCCGGNAGKDYNGYTGGYSSGIRTQKVVPSSGVDSNDTVPPR